MKTLITPVVIAAAIAGLCAPAALAQGQGPDRPWPGTRLAKAAPPAGQSAKPAAGQPAAAADTAPAPAGTSGKSPWTEDYHLGPGDKLRIEVYKDPQLSQSLQIRPDGKITMPLIGDLVAADLTPLQLRDKIAGSLKEYVTSPTVTVIVVETLASSVYVMGEVAKSGPLPYQGQMTALQALAMAGGFKDFANTKDIKILRRGPNGVETIKFNYRDAVKGGPPVYLRAGDTVIVP
jgi:polysaccharide biosynthesis/export protein